jgi:hypothetical protein
VKQVKNIIKWIFDLSSSSLQKTGTVLPIAAGFGWRNGG